MERKQTEAYITGINEDQGIVEAIWAVMGNVDEGGDVIHPGSFSKTFSERGQDVALLDNHQTDSIMRSLGNVLALRELRRGELPPDLQARYPEATGGAWGQFKFLLDVPEGAGAFSRLKNRAIKKWSFGYDALDKDFSKAVKDGQEITVRNLRTIKLYEVSPVLFAMNAATDTLSAKAAPGDEAKPWNVFKRGDRWAVYKVDADGNPTGEALGTHDTEEEARAQVRALYANERQREKPDVGGGAGGDTPVGGESGIVALKDENAEKDVMADYPWDQCMRDQMDRYGDEETARRVCGAIRANASADVTMETARAKVEKELGIKPKKAGSWGEPKTDYELEGIKVGRAIAKRNAERIKLIRAILAELEQEAMLEGESTAPQDGAANDSQQKQAGPVTPPTVAELERQTLELELSLLEV